MTIQKNTAAQEAHRAERMARIAKEDATPDDQLTPEQLARKQGRAYKRKQRGSERKEKIAVVSTSEQDWYDRNRAAMSPEDFTALLAQNELVLDQLYWMDHGHQINEEDPDYVSLKDGIADLLSFVKEFGVAHLGDIHRDQSIPYDWSMDNFWQNSELLTALENESEPTKVYVRTGLLIGLPDWKVVNFLQKSGWTFDKAAAVVGWCESQKRFVVKVPCR